MVDGLNRAYKRAVDDFKGYGLDDTKLPGGNTICSVRGAWLKKGETKISSPMLTPGVEYAIIAAGNAHIKKVSLKILDAGKKSAAKEGDPILTESAEGNNAPGCTVMLDTAQYGSKPSTVGVRIHVEEMEDEDMPKDDGWEVPLENFGKATASFQERLNAIQAANPDGAEIAYDSIPLQGVVLPTNGFATIDTPYPAGKPYKFIAASDDNTELLGVSVGGNLQIPTQTELGTGNPKLTYTKGLKPSAGSTGQWSVRNKGKATSIILTAAIRLVQGS